MSFWPRLRRRSRGRKRSSAKPNPYASIGLDKLAVAHAEFDSQRALFAAEKGVSVSVVRFVSGSSRGWTLLPHSSPSSEGEEDSRSSTSSTAPSSPVRASFQVPASPRTHPQRTSSTKSVSEAQPTPSRLVQPPIPDSRRSEVVAEAEAPSSSSPPAFVNAGGSDFTELESWNTEDQVVLSQKDQAWSKLTKTASVLLVSLGVFSTALGFNTVFAIIVGSWNQGKSSFKRVFSILATQLLSAIRPSLQLKHSSGVVSGKSISSSEEVDMKVTPTTPISPIVSSKGTDAESGRSSFAFPVLSRDNSVGTPIFRVQQDLSTSEGQHQQQQALVAVPALRPVVTSVKVVAVSSQPGSPAFDGSKGCQKPCQKFKARIFKCHPLRKVTPATSENSSAEEDAADGGAEVEPPIKAPGTKSPRSSDSPRCKRLSFIKRRSKSSMKGIESDEQLSGQSTTESELEDVSSPVTRVVTVKAAKSSEILASKNPSSGPAVAAKKVSRSQELKLSFKNLKKKYRSQELCPVAANQQEYQQMALESAAIRGLDEPAFPVDHETDSSSCSTPSTSAPKGEKRKSCLVKMLSGEYEKSGEGGVSSPRTATTTTSSSSSRLNKSHTSPASRMPTEKTTIIDYRPELRKVKTALANVPLPAEYGELARSPVLDREILGSLLILAVLVFLLLGKIAAILGTASFCLILSHVQKFMSNNLSPREKERLVSKGGGSVGLSRLGGNSPPHSHGHGSATAATVDVQSSEYRKKVLIDGFLDRGNRRTG